MTRGDVLGIAGVGLAVGLGLLAVVGLYLATTPVSQEVAIATTPLVSVFSPTPTVASSPQSGPPDGQAIYANRCAACHGQKGDQLQKADLGSREFLDSVGEEGLFTAIAEGKGGMPGFGKVKGGALTDDDIRAVMKYLDTLAGR